MGKYVVLFLVITVTIGNKIQLGQKHNSHSDFKEIAQKWKRKEKSLHNYETVLNLSHIGFDLTFLPALPSSLLARDSVSTHKGGVSLGDAACPGRGSRGTPSARLLPGPGSGRAATIDSVRFCTCPQRPARAPLNGLLGAAGQTRRRRLILAELVWICLIRGGRSAPGQICRLLITLLFFSAQLSYLSFG